MNPSPITLGKIIKFSKNAPKTQSDQTDSPSKLKPNYLIFNHSSSSSSSTTTATTTSSSSPYFFTDSPLRTNQNATPSRFFGKPFSWEQLPGIPKKSENHKKNQTTHLLMPPPFTPPSSRKHPFEDLFGTSKKNHLRKDPFFAALVECSKGEDDESDVGNNRRSSIWNGGKISRRITERFGSVNLYSCKTSCSVSESIVYLPRNRASYDLINRHPT